jgi:signal transduction histidine kinase/CheY-like chemotaxis protein
MVGRRGIIGLPMLEVFPELANTHLAHIIDRVHGKGEPFVTNEMLIPLDRTGNGEPEDCWFQFNLEPLRDATGVVYGMMAVAVEITQQVTARRDVELAQAERETLLHDLERVSRAKDEFLAMLGHELRNPLSPILTALQLMQLRGISGADRERAIIERQVKHVVTLVDDLLDVARITRGTIEIRRQRVQLADVIAKAIEQASPLIEQRRHRLNVDVPGDVHIDGDSGRLAQVFSNVLTNAAKYTEPGGEIDVRAVPQQKNVCVHIRDNGIGIGSDIMPHIFDAFAQERQRSDRSQGGLGLGLAIVRNLVEAHGGSVRLASDGIGRGTECTVCLPLAARATLVDAPIVGPIAGADRPDGFRILLVDDNEDAAEMLRESLKPLGHSVELAFDASSALEIATRYVPDIALLDLGLPVIDGYELAERLREQDGWDGVRFAALTGYGQESDRDRTKAAGFDAHLVKPIELEILDDTLRGLMAENGPGGSVS